METETTHWERSIERIFREAPVLRLDDTGKFVIISDLHMGDGGWTDDFAVNSELFLSTLSRNYFPKGYTLILNGDVEELQRFSRRSITQRWSDAYSIFDSFARDNRLHRIVGNHDLNNLNDLRNSEYEVPLEGIRLEYRDDTIFVLHGHQVLWKYERFNRWIGYALKYALNPLKIRNRTVAHNSRKRFATEQRIYEFARQRGILAVIGHTHRPLFESLSKVDVLRFEIERLCQEYPRAEGKRKESIRKRVKEFQRDLIHVDRNERTEGARRSLYNADFVMPCVFNSGCVLGKRGMTALEINKGRIRLVHWFDANRDPKYLNRQNLKKVRSIENTSFHRVVLKQDNLSYVFSRVRLLS